VSHGRRPPGPQRRPKPQNGRRPIHTVAKLPPERCPAPGCGKLCYSTRKRACAGMARAAKTTGEDRADWQVYKCASGNGWWHFAHQMSRKARGLTPGRVENQRTRSDHDPER
jgi:hypothetical protein